MRLSNTLTKKIVHSIEHTFGQVDVYLFGSRTDDLKCGGDIDIAIDSTLSKHEFKEAKAKLIAFLMLNGLEDLPLDISQLNAATDLFNDEIQKTKIKLN